MIPQPDSPYLTDASGYRGAAERVFVPESEAEIAEILREATAALNAGHDRWRRDWIDGRPGAAYGLGGFSGAAAEDGDSRRVCDLRGGRVAPGFAGGRGPAPVLCA